MGCSPNHPSNDCEFLATKNQTPLKCVATSERIYEPRPMPRHSHTPRVFNIQAWETRFGTLEQPPAMGMSQATSRTQVSAEAMGFGSLSLLGPVPIATSAAPLTNALDGTIGNGAVAGPVLRPAHNTADARVSAPREVSPGSSSSGELSRSGKNLTVHPAPWAPRPPSQPIRFSSPSSSSKSDEIESAVAISQAEVTARL